MTDEACNALLPLLHAQNYIDMADIWRGESIDFDLDNFRMQIPWDGNLSDRHAKAAGLSVGDVNKPWLTVDCPLTLTGRPVVFARSKNYRGIDDFWERCYSALSPLAFFIGSASEHEEFCEPIGVIRHVRTENLLEVARLIGGATLFVGNQSCPYAIAEALKRPVIQETHLPVPNCIFPRPDAAFITSLEELEAALQANASRLPQG